MTAEQMAELDFDPLDATKIWPESLVPARKIGQLVLNRNVDNVFQETEQVGMSPSNLVPGIQPSEDRLLQGRLFAYPDTQIYRIGTTGLNLPINRPLSGINNVNQDGHLNGGHTTGGVNYEPSRMQSRPADVRALAIPTAVTGMVQQKKIQREQNFKQAGELYRSFSKKEQQDLIQSFGGALATSKDETKHIILSFLYKADPDYGAGVARVAGGDLARVKQLAGRLQD